MALSLAGGYRRRRSATGVFRRLLAHPRWWSRPTAGGSSYSVRRDALARVNQRVLHGRTLR